MMNDRDSDGSDSSLSSSPTKKQRWRPLTSGRAYGDVFQLAKQFTINDPASPSKGKVSKIEARRVTTNMAVARPRGGWPSGRIPIEIFDEIISYLPRSSVKSMRLVNQEFEKKVSATFFQVVVVPFKPELYGIGVQTSTEKEKPGQDGELSHGSHILEDKGMRVFHGFGEKIKKFAMSFEVEEEMLAKPPLKDDQQAITTFWGIYPWPYTKYNRYVHLEGLEQIADETKAMAGAFRHITMASELGLSLDGGLGLLSGPDINPRVFARGRQLPVFGTPKYAPESVAKSKSLPKQALPVPIVISANEQRYEECERMCRAAGYAGEDLRPATELLLRNDHIWIETARSSPPVEDSSPAQKIRPVNFPSIDVAHDSDSDYNADDDDEYADRDRTFRSRLVQRAKPKAPAKPDVTALKPAELNSAQREMLLEIEWAQRAFVQSYSIAIIDNAAVFKNIKMLTIARLPSRHLSILQRKDFWDALPGLVKLSLAVIPDWRDVTKDPTGWVQDVKVAPSSAVEGVYQLLHQQIAVQRNITTVHFEWICGGEYSPGLFSRNQHILPMPVVSSAANMVNRTQDYVVLKLPYVKHLSMKNCWSSPHIMRQFHAAHLQTALESLTYDSVSLTKSIPQGAHPGVQPAQQPIVGLATLNFANVAHANAAAPVAPPANAAANGQAQPDPVPAAVVAPPPFIIGQGNNFTTIVPPQASETAVDENGEPNWLQPPWHDSWVSILDDITPGRTLDDMRFQLGFGEQPKPRVSRGLKRLDFTSCGYVLVPLDFDQQYFNGHAVLVVPPGLGKRISDLEPCMMKASDNLLARITNYIPAREVNTLQNVFNLTVGWWSRDEDRAELILDCELDGVPHAGHGRFDGVITAE